MKARGPCCGSKLRKPTSGEFADLGFLAPPPGIGAANSKFISLREDVLDAPRACQTIQGRHSSKSPSLVTS